MWLNKFHCQKDILGTVRSTELLACHAARDGRCHRYTMCNWQRGEDRHEGVPEPEHAAMTSLGDAEVSKLIEIELGALISRMSRDLYLMRNLCSVGSRVIILWHHSLCVVDISYNNHQPVAESVVP